MRFMLLCCGIQQAWLRTAPAKSESLHKKPRLLDWLLYDASLAIGLSFHLSSLLFLVTCCYYERAYHRDSSNKDRMSKKESALDLARFIDKEVRVKLAGGREGEPGYIMAGARCTLRPQRFGQHPCYVSLICAPFL